MNRTRQQTKAAKAAKARNDWELLQEQLREQKEIRKVLKFKKVKSAPKEISLRETA